MPRTDTVDWRSLIDDIVISELVAFCHASGGAVRNLYLTGSYTRGTWNPERPNVNMYFIAESDATARVRADLGRVFAGIRRRSRERGADFMVDCHPFTVSDRDAEWLDRPLLTLTTKVFDVAHADEKQRLLVSPTIGYGWWATHRMLFGHREALEMLAVPPGRDEAWFRGAHAALSQYRYLLDHLPWAIDVDERTDRFIEETCRYAEESIKDGVHFGSTDEEIASAANVEILHRWKELARDFFAERYGDQGVWAVDTVAKLKENVLRPGHSPETALAFWVDAIGVWTVVWEGFVRQVDRHQMPGDLKRVISWM